MSNQEIESLQKEIRNLPIYGARLRLVQEIRKNKTVVIVGETGSGKTTQLPQYVYDGYQKGVIAITQPRRVAAITVALRVAKERNLTVGHLVGYCVRFEDATTSNSHIIYMTDGMLLRQAVLDPLLTRYRVIVLDEAHERTVHTDVLFAIVKSAQKQRLEKRLPLLKIIIMSASLNADQFSQYFNNAPVIYVQGRQHHVEVLFTKVPQNDYLFSSVVTVFQIHQRDPPDKDILLFLSGQDEIDSVVRTIRDIASDLPSTSPKLHVLPLYAALQSQKQLLVFNEAPQGMRKVIVSTNIAETSITIPRIGYVIDSGKVKAKVHKPESGVDLLKVVSISKAQATQRTGRAGREMPGVCYRLYTEFQYDTFEENTIPEILRCNLTSVMLHLLAMGITNVTNVDFMDKPSPQAIDDAINILYLLGAIRTIDSCQLTEEGKQMAAFPLEPKLSKTILSAATNNCLEEVLTIVSFLSGESILVTPLNKRDESESARIKFTSNYGDHLMMLNIYRSFRHTTSTKQWCKENFIHHKNVKAAINIRSQLRDICMQRGLTLASCGQDLTPIRKSFAAGFFMNAAEFQNNNTYLALSNRIPVTIHPSSCLHQSQPSYVIYNELTVTSKAYIRDVCVVEAEWLYETAPNFFAQKIPIHNKR